MFGCVLFYFSSCWERRIRASLRFYFVFFRTLRASFFFFLWDSEQTERGGRSPLVLLPTFNLSSLTSTDSPLSPVELKTGKKKKKK